MKKTILLLSLGVFLLCPSLWAQQPVANKQPGNYFKEAYEQYPDVPKGLLEAMAYSASRMNNLHVNDQEETNCMGMPLQYGLFGLVEDGKGYFKSTMQEVCALSNITTETFKKDARMQVLAVAKYLSRNAKPSIEEFAIVLENLSGIPEDGSSVNTFARRSHSFDVYTYLQKGFTAPGIKQLPASIQFKKIYPDATLRVLQSPGVNVNFDKDRVRMPDGTTITPASNTSTVTGSVSANQEMGVLSADYPPAIWNPAASCNFNTGRSATITHVAIHTTQGSYASTLSWFKNCAASVSAHYVIRSSDGQVTQMVAESNTAWHIANNNSYTVGIEHEAFAADPAWFTENMYQSSAALTRDICASRGIDVNTCFRGPGSGSTNPQPASYRIKGHQHFPIANGKWDPGPHWNWPKYADLLQGSVNLPYGVYRAINPFSGKYLDASGCTGANGSITNIYSWTGADCQRWLFEPLGDGYYKISCRLGGRVIDNDKCLADNANKIQLWDWLNNDCQRWSLRGLGNGEVAIVNKFTGKVLDVAGAGTANGTQVFQYAFSGGIAQRWRLEEVSSNYIAPGLYRIVLDRNANALTPANGVDVRGSIMTQSDYVDSNYQKWQVTATPDGWYKVTSANGSALDVDVCNTLDGGKVMLWDWLDNNCQRWGFSTVPGGKWAIVSRNSKKVLDAVGDANGGTVYQWTWLNNSNQIWRAEAVTITARKAGADELTVAPNPVISGKSIQLIYKSDIAQPGTISITDVYGRPVQLSKVSIQKGNNIFTVSTSSLRPGLYNTTILPNNNRKVDIKKIIVVK